MTCFYASSSQKFFEMSYFTYHSDDDNHACQDTVFLSHTAGTQ